MNSYQAYAGRKVGNYTAVKPTGEYKGKSRIWEIIDGDGNVSFQTLTNAAKFKISKSSIPKSKKSYLPVNRIYGDLKALRRTEKLEKTEHIWEFQCVCGDIVYMTLKKANNIRKNTCKYKEQPLKKSYITDITNKTYGYLTAIRPTNEKIKKCRIWEFQCICGQQMFLTTMQARHVKHCGCKYLDAAPDITGQTFGDLKAIRRTGELKRYSAIYEFECNCGKHVFYTQSEANQKKHCDRKIHRNKYDPTGKLYGTLVAIEKTNDKKNGLYIWKFKCSICGKVVYLTTPDASYCNHNCSNNHEIKRRNVIEKTYGEFKPIRRTDKMKGKSLLWEVECSCGKRMLLTLAEALLKGNCHKILRQNIVRNVYGDLVALECTDERKSGRRIWKYKCNACGKTVAMTTLNARSKKNCGCLNKSRQNIVGNVYGDLVALECTDERKSGRRIWKYKCKACGKTVAMTTPTAMRKKNCGCKKNSQYNLNISK